MYNRRYDKVFLMLRQETAGYGLGQRAPWGSCVMEIKNGTGRISLTVQGLRPIQRGRYAVYAIAGEKEKQTNLFCGVLVPDAAGHCELKWDFNPDRLGERNATVEDFNTVAVLAETDGGFSAPLTAYFVSKTDWRTYFKEPAKQKNEGHQELKNRKEGANVKSIDKIREVEKAREAERIREAEKAREAERIRKTEKAKEAERIIAEAEKTKEAERMKEVEKAKEAERMKEVPQGPTLAAAEAMAMSGLSFGLPKVNWKRDGIKNDGVENETVSQKDEPALAKETKKESYHGSFRGLLEKFRNELEELQEEGIFTSKEMERIERAGRRNLHKSENVEIAQTLETDSAEKEVAKSVVTSSTLQEPAKVELSVEDLPQNSFEEVVEDRNATVQEFLDRYKLLQDNTNIYPFGEDDTPWKCISIEEMVLLEGIPLAWMKDFFVIKAMKKYHHLIWKPQNDGYSIGVPGTEELPDRTKATKLGFGEFRKMDDGALGYWIFTKK
ncbi:hypothetical protein [Anaerotignum propionicum]|uniref:hypothetical protein n=1 Tax=Anaerotignum propionicum TaxID=28446 RepID=UPI00210A0F16|nr:hypothetical protein [Anaerotignum propionicum]MCQ4937371.1 hypothetical protein [Anaerotignum propionicum]